VAGTRNQPGPEEPLAGTAPGVGAETARGERRYDGPMAEEISVQERLKEIRARLDWVRDYL